MNTPDDLEPVNDFLNDQMESATAFLEFILKCPTIVPEAPRYDGEHMAQIMESRASKGHHTCIRCGDPSQVAYVIQTTIGPRWLDLCLIDAHFVNTAAGTNPVFRSQHR